MEPVVQRYTVQKPTKSRRAVGTRGIVYPSSSREQECASGLPPSTVYRFFWRELLPRGPWYRSDFWKRAQGIVIVFSTLLPGAATSRGRDVWGVRYSVQVIRIRIRIGFCTELGGLEYGLRVAVAVAGGDRSCFGG